LASLLQLPQALTGAMRGRLIKGVITSETMEDPLLQT
jgi:hypothetical protein